MKYECDIKDCNKEATESGRNIFGQDFQLCKKHYHFERDELSKEFYDSTREYIETLKREMNVKH